MMEVQSEQGRILHGSGQAVTGEKQTATNTEPDAGLNTPPVDVHNTGHGIAASDPPGVPDLKENTPAMSKEKASNHTMIFQHQPDLAQESSKADTKRGTQSSDAIRRGLSFGPIKKPGEQQGFTHGILKTTSKSPPPRLYQRSLSVSSEGPDTSDVGQLEKDYFVDNDGGEDIAESSEDDTRGWGSDDETSLSGRPRGRNRDGTEESEAPTATEGDKPEVTITAPEVEKLITTSKRFDIVRPNTNFDRSVSKTPSLVVSPNTTDSEEMENIRYAQNLNIDPSDVDQTIHNRVIQTILRGEFREMLKESREGTRRVRDYLIATDLSEEAVYALEWTIGTVLRDGDTLYVIYAIDDESGAAKTGDAVPIGEGGKAMQDTTAIMEKMTATTKKGPLMSLPSSLSKAAFRASSRSSSAVRSDSEAHAKTAQDRLRAKDKLVETCVGFLRRTKLQVRIVIEVIHCKSSRHMITEAIDVLDPTLVIIGSRGMGTLRGVLLGSFSNYLVTKSSAPVMVARKKLAGKAKHSTTHQVQRLPNNLTPPKPMKKLAEAKID